MIKKIIISSIAVGILLPSFAFSQTGAPVKVPGDIKEAKETGERVFETSKKAIPGIIENIKKSWEEEVLPIWQKMWNWFKINIWLRVKSWFGPEIEKRKPQIQEDFKKEKKEMKEGLKIDIPKTGKSLWEKFKELFR